MFEHILGPQQINENKVGQIDLAPSSSNVHGKHHNRKPLDRRRLIDGAPRRVSGVGELTELHHEICRLLLFGMKNVDIARKLNCTPQTVSNVRNSPIVKHRLRELSDRRDKVAVDFAAQIRQRTEKAFEIIDEALYDETEEVPLMIRLKEANNLLDRAEKVEGIGQKNLHIHAHLTAEDIENLKKRALEVGLANGTIIPPSEISSDAIEVEVESV